MYIRHRLRGTRFWRADGDALECPEAIDIADKARAGRQNKQQDADVFGALGGNAAILRPDDYHKVDNKRDIDTHATIIGIRAATGDWSMYAQIFNVSMLGRAMIEVKKIC